MKLSKDNIVAKHFSKKTFGGLNEFEVRDFLHILAEEIRHLTRLTEQQTERIRDLEERIQDYREREHILKRSIVSAQEIADKIQKDTEQKSRLIIARANDRSEALVRQARSSLQSVYNDISGLKRLHLQFKSSLKASLQSQMELLDQTPLFSLSLPEGETSPQEGREDASSSLSDSALETEFSPEEKQEAESAFSAEDSSFKAEGTTAESTDSMESKTASKAPSEESMDSLETLKQSLQSLEKDLF